MKTELFWVLPIVAIVVVSVLLAVAQFIVSSRFAARIEDVQRRLAAGQASTPAPDPERLPELVRRFAERAGAVVGAPPVVRLDQSLTMRLGVDKPWQALTAVHWAGTRASGFVWHARGKMMGLGIGVVDAYVDGAGLLNARLLNSISVAMSEGVETDRGELLRYLAEIPLTPDAILNNPALVWTQVDDRRVSVATPVSATGGSVTVVFTFDEAGDIVEALADRPMIVDGTCTDVPWQGLFFDYRQLGARRIPTRAEVGWRLPDGLYTYFRGTIESCTLESAP